MDVSDNRPVLTDTQGDAPNDCMNRQDKGWNILCEGATPKNPRSLGEGVLRLRIQIIAVKSMRKKYHEVAISQVFTLQRVLGLWNQGLWQFGV